MHDIKTIERKEEMMKQFVEKLRQENIGNVKLNEPLSKHTTIKLGGPAQIYVEPNSIESLKRLMELIRQENTEWFVIGRGSNLLVKDGGLKCVVINLSK